MNESLILDHFVQAPQLRNLQDTISQSEKHIYLKGVNGSALSFLVAQLFKDLSRPFLFLMNDKEEAAYLLNDLELLVTKMPVLFYPGSYRRPYELEEIDNSNVLQRAEVLNRIQNNSKPYILVSYPDALFEKVVNKKDLKRATLKLKSGGGQSLDKLNETLFEFEFKRVDFVTEPGEFSLRGGILDIFSFSHDEPYRIEFFGDQIESIRTFDIETQLSIKKVNRIEVIPNVADKFRKEARVSFFEFLDPKTLLWFNNPDLTKDKLDRLYKKAVDAFSKIESPLSHMSPEQLFMKGTSLAKDLHSFTSIYLTEPATDQDTAEAKNTTVQFETTPQPVFNKNFDLLIENLRTNHERGLSNIICCASQQQADRLHEIFDEIVAEVPYKTLQLPIHAGFYSQELKIACYTDHQIFERYHKFQLRNSYAKKQAITLKELNKLEMGDYVTHIDHGIGKFGGLQKIDVEGKKQEAIKLMYGDRDILYVSIHSLHKISKYNGKDGAVPKIYKLGSAAWKKIKQKTKSRVKKIAFDLISVYAKRKMKEGFQYDPDSYLQHELEASFLYEDTPDQSKVTEEIKQDMESPRPMDRLVCGDVGFGKTEVAIRAAFKAVDNGKQVAILVPTTILAFQHHRTFTERLKNLPVSVDYLNRFRSAKEKREIISRLANGQLEIIIGTHQLVNPQIKFKNLGLLIVDE
ncbi:MAG: DEAD/DEAH box helicase, partial [Flavobacteriaceae bacterium]|nr:DEAD/DEAH box helicase [Flavobacteriaceae bacterium]